MTLHSPLWQQPLDYAAVEDRQLIAAAIGDAGVVGAPSLAVTQRAAGANMTVDVAPGRAVIAGVAGSYHVWSDDVENLAIAAAPSSGNGRIDLVYAQVRDAQATGSGSHQDWILGVVTGTPSGSPTAPTLPTHSIELARITLTDATTSITDGIITSSRTHSASLADRVWPLVAVNAPSDITQGVGAVSYGTVTIPAPNRQVKLFAWFDCYAVADAGDTNVVPTLSIRASWGSSTQSTTPIKGFSESAFHTTPLSRSLYHAFTPGIGEAITVVGRVQAESGGDAVFTNGRLMVQVFPA
jgi:hypothetical protein